ncbi:MAG TPA: hypothetical protein VFM10_09870 [Terriglobales bacterium]|nr:hypothetical protein [Terriglobales bacterium]
MRRIDGYWRAANYLSIGQIYLYANPLPREPPKRQINPPFSFPLERSDHARGSVQHR